MRHILLSCAILLLALSFCLFSMLHIREICKQTLCALTSAQEQAQIYNFEACPRVPCSRHCASGGSMSAILG